ncbi:LPS export ABC transporter periplasmic protein LptC [Mucilaginibacter sp. ZB1P21]|uniref:LPS export ABC transporter periplasmic protein LptC n=2 Tax=Mucilaginibacter glaciei TaxID=2772109 RepID=A0A926NT00_9SPHI|nr:LPS export ABC transporter periplasmic protein LptC [Mucilaginibacter glaciei]
MQQGQVKYLKLYLPAIVMCLFLFGACENDLNKVRAIAAADSTKDISQTVGVEMLFSDSAIVKLKLTAPLSISYKDKKKQPITLMPHGVKVVFYDVDIKQIGNIVADTGIQRETEKLIIFRKNVVATNPEGTVYKSEELIYDQGKKQIYSTKNVLMTKVGGDQMTGTSFVSDDKLLHPIFQNATAVIHVDNSIAQ